MINNSIYILVLIFALVLPNTKVNNYKITSEQKRFLNQAKSLKKNGLIEESKNVYMDLFNSYPYLIEALDPLKTILKKQKKWEELEKIAFKFQESYDFNFYSKAKTFEILLWIDNKIYFDILSFA